MRRVVAAVLAAVFLVVLAAPAASAAPPTKKQFNALKQRVAKLEKQRRTLTRQVGDLQVVVFGCMGFVQGVSQFGGYTGSSTTALDYDDSDVPQMWVQLVDPACVTGFALKATSFRYQRIAR